MNPFFYYKFRSASATDIGQRRLSNQDAAIECPDLGFFAVADGMGGLTDGKEAADMVVQLMPAQVERCLATVKKQGFTPESASQLLIDAAKTVSDEIYETCNSALNISHGATLTGVWLVDAYAIFINLGDSRGYLLQKGKRQIRQITRDHNIAQMLVDRGEITKDEARDHDASYRITRFTGMAPPASPQAFAERVAPGDQILLCSDGLHGMVWDDEIKELMRSSKSPKSVCEKLIFAANTCGGDDNIAVVNIRITMPDETH